MKILTLLCLLFPWSALAATQSIEIIDKIKRERTDNTDSRYFSKFAQWGDNEVVAPTPIQTELDVTQMLAWAFGI